MRPYSVLATLLSLLCLSCGSGETYEPLISEPPWIEGSPGARGLTFTIASDMRGAVGAEGEGLFLDALLALKGLDAAGAGSFLVSPGDLDPASSGVEAAIQSALGPAFPWFALPGNHDAETAADMAYLRSRDLAAAAAGAGAANFSFGPGAAEKTCYSFDAGGAHFLFLNEYYDGSSEVGTGPSSASAGGIAPALYDWIAADLDAAQAHSPAYCFVFGHEPLYPLPDEATARVRHRGDSLDAHPREAKAFSALLLGHGATAYLCGHSHDYSAALVDGLLQIEVGRAAGLDDTGAPSTCLRATLYGSFVEFEVYRSTDGSSYSLAASVRAAPRP